MPLILVLVGIVGIAIAFPPIIFLYLIAIGTYLAK